MAQNYLGEDCKVFPILLHHLTSIPSWYETFFSVLRQSEKGKERLSLSLSLLFSIDVLEGFGKISKVLERNELTSRDAHLESDL